jgi:hypothetical protein
MSEMSGRWDEQTHLPLWRLELGGCASIPGIVFAC